MKSLEDESGEDESGARPSPSKVEETSMQSNIVKNERRKLTASYLNGVALAIFVVGYIGPIVNLPNRALSPLAVMVMIVASFVSLGFHIWARRVLLGLK